MPLPNKLPSNLTYNDLSGAEAIEVLKDWFVRLLQSHPQFQPHLTLPMCKMTLDVQVNVDMFIGGSVPIESPPEHLDVIGAVTVDNNLSGPTGRMIEGLQSFHTEINAAPIAGGRPPDQIRSEHGLVIPRPAFGPRDTGQHIFMADPPPALPGKQPPSEPIGARQGNIREGIVAEGYTFAAEPGPVQQDRQHIPIDKGALDVDLGGQGINHAGIQVSGGTHVSSVKEFGDQKGQAYGSVSGVYDAGPAGLARPGRSGGLYSDGRPRIEKFK